MKSGKSQLIAIILSAVIAFTFGFGGGLAADYLSEKNIISISSLLGQTSDVPDLVETEEEPESDAQAKPAPVEISPSQPVNIEVGEDITVAEAIAEKVQPSVVGVTTTYEVTTGGYGGGLDYFFGFGGGGGQSYEQKGVGTGFVVDKDGYIVTNAHVINDGTYKKIIVSLFDGTEAEAKALWSDATLDLAIIKISAKNLTVAELGDSDELRIGSYAAAIGNPLGLAFERSMSQGIISGLDRTITVSDGSSVKTMDGLIQTDATINSGNSGGPLLNSKGLVVGINSARASNGEGMGFAIPINTAKPIIEQVKATGTYARPYIGITGVGLGDQTGYTEEELYEYFGTNQGVYVSSIIKGGGAQAAGLKEKDIILEIAGHKVSTMNKLNQILTSYKIGESVKLTVLRDGKTFDLWVTLTDGLERN